MAKSKKHTHVCIAEYPRLIEKVYIHEGIKVGVRINFRDKKISLTETDGQGVKKWVFAEREVEYMDGWRSILKAMDYAIGQAEKELSAYIEREDEEQAALILEVAKV